jgi:hypothetical protein
MVELLLEVIEAADDDFEGSHVPEVSGASSHDARQLHGQRINSVTLISK